MKIQEQHQRENVFWHVGSTIAVIKEYFLREWKGSRARIRDDHVLVTVGSAPDAFIVYADGLDDGPCHRIHLASIWDVDLPSESSQPILEAIQTINDFSTISTVSAFEFDEQLSISTSLEMTYPVRKHHVKYALGAHLDLARKCVDPLFAVAFLGASGDEIANLFKRPQETDMH